jgi:putative PIN family toxin of toxin-antitoxin system
VRLVLDTNLLISALISPHGAPAQLIDAWNDDRFVLISSSEQVEEFREVSRRKRLAPLIQRSEAGTFVNQLHAKATILERLPSVERSVDPADNFLLAMAEAGEADYLVSGDRRGVLALEQHGNTQIVTARAMLAKLSIPGSTAPEKPR